jgi:hypothetical protein
MAGQWLTDAIPKITSAMKRKLKKLEKVSGEESL